MGTSTKLVALTSCLIATVFAAGLLVNAPPYTPGTPLENGLIASISFDKPSYFTLEAIRASLVYLNPSKTSITFTPPSILSVESGYVKDSGNRHISGRSPTEPVTLGPGETYSIDVAYEIADIPGIFRVDVNGTYGTIEVTQSQLVARIATDREVYVASKGGGTATLEIFNSGSTPQSYENFSPLELRYWYEGESPSDRRHVVFVSWMDRFTTVQPGESHKIWSFTFDTPKAGTLILDFNDVRRSVVVLPGS